MKAAIINDFTRGPEYGDFPDPKVEDGEVEVHVLAAAVSQLARARANGTHYSAASTLPIVPGVDAVGETADGEHVYFNSSNNVYGTLAEKAVVNRRALFPIDNTADPAVVAATANPAMSSFMAIKERLGEDKIRGKRVLVLGATGASGHLAIPISISFGATEVIGVGRNPEKLAKLSQFGVTSTIKLTDNDDQLKADLARIGDVDVALDYLWGDIAATMITDMIAQRQDPQHTLTWVQIGSMAGQSSPLKGSLFRSIDFHLIGSGFGSFTAANLADDMPALLKMITDGKIAVPLTTFPLSQIAEKWNDYGDNRLVFLP